MMTRSFAIMTALLAGSALSACGGSSQSSPPAVTPMVSPPANTAPDAPTIGTLSPGDTQISVSFTAPSSNGGSAITAYTARCEGGSATVTATGTSSPILVTGLTNDTAYSCSVTAQNAVGNSPASAAVSATPMAPVTTTPPPPPPAGVTGKTIRTSELGWIADENISAKFETLLDGTLEAGDLLIVDAMYRIAGAGYTLPEDVTLQGSLAGQAAGFSSLDGVRELADKYGIPYNNNVVFDVSDRVRVENLTFTQDEVDTTLLESGGTKQGWFGVFDVDDFQFVGNRVDAIGWSVITAADSDNILIEGNSFNSPKAGLAIRSGDRLRFVHNFATGGYNAPRIGGNGTNFFMDVIKTTRPGEGPTNAIISGNVFADIVRDAVDTTGGLANANIYDNAFSDMFAGLDLKSVYDSASGTADGLVKNTNINVSENVFFDVQNSVVTTSLFRDEETPSLDFAVQRIYSQNNVYRGGTNGLLIKNSKEIFGTDDYFAGVNPFRAIDAYDIGNGVIDIDVRLRNTSPSGEVNLDMAVAATGVNRDSLSLDDIKALNRWFIEAGQSQRTDYLADQSIDGGFVDAFTANEQVTFGTADNDVMEVGDGLDLIDMSGGNDLANFVAIDRLLDVIQNFETGDIIDVSGVIDFGNASFGDYPRFLRLVELNGDTAIEINVDGQGTDFVGLAIIEGGVDDSLNDLVIAGAITF